MNVYFYVKVQLMVYTESVYTYIHVFVNDI